MAETPSRISRLAEPRPVLRGLRPGGCGRPGHRAPRPLAEPRPVLRGLRLTIPVPALAPMAENPCRAETRSQGIATLPTSRPRPGRLVHTCRAETRSQGIATSSSASRSCRTSSPCRAETRSQGIATTGSGGPPGRPGGPLAEPRPVLRGLRLAIHDRMFLSTVNSSCRAETRSQGIATGIPGLTTMEGGGPLQSRDPFSGDCDMMSRTSRRTACTLQSRDPFSGDCDGEGKAKGARGSNTCFREIATRRLTPRETSITLGASGAGFPQCGDPCAGDCDTTKMKAHCSSVSS
jgi:hypothetical protein